MIKIDQLVTRCMMREEQFINIGDVQETLRDDDFLIYVDRGASVLAIAHLDTYLDFEVSQRVAVLNRRSNGSPMFVMSPALDNRLGVHILLDVLPSYGVNVDVLLTTSEELLDTSGQDFTPSRQYNWMFSLDRDGSDAVLYQYEHPEIVAELHKHGIGVARGTYSDIVDMENIGAVGINFGNGVFSSHTTECGVMVPMANAALSRFLSFYSANKDEQWPYAPVDDDAEDDDAEDDAWAKSWLYGGVSSHMQFCDMCGASIEPGASIYSGKWDGTLCLRCASAYGEGHNE